MPGPFTRSCRIGAGCLAGALLLAACHSGPYRVTRPASALVALAVPDLPEDQDGERIDHWGGIVQDTLPTVPVDDGGLGEVE